MLIIYLECDVIEIPVCFNGQVPLKWPVKPFKKNNNNNPVLTQITAHQMEEQF